MIVIVSMLEEQTSVHDLNMDPSIYANHLRFRSLRETNVTAYDQAQVKDNASFSHQMQHGFALLHLPRIFIRLILTPAYVTSKVLV